MTKSIYFLEGFYAFHDYMNPEDNPYQDNYIVEIMKRSNWEEGFTQAEKQFKADIAFFCNR